MVLFFAGGRLGPLSRHSTDNGGAATSRSTRGSGGGAEKLRYIEDDLHAAYNARRRSSGGHVRCEREHRVKFVRRHREWEWLARGRNQ